MCLVRHETGHEHCTCPDFQQRQGKGEQPGKHILAAQIAAGTAQLPEHEINERNENRETIARLKGRHSLALLNADDEEVERLRKGAGHARARSQLEDIGYRAGELDPSRLHV
jgi:hypothetical protein